MLVGIASVKGSPGVTTTALGLAAVWPGAATLLVEADPSGGDVAVWRRLAPSPGLATLASAVRHRPATPAARAPDDDVRMLAHAHDLGRHLYAVPGPAGAEQARRAVGTLASRPRLVRSTVGLGGAVNTTMVDTVVVDLGRLDPGSVARPLIADLDVLLLMAPGSVAGLAHLAARPPVLADGVAGAAHVGMLLARQCRFRPREVEEAIGLPLLGILPEDPPSAQMLAGTASAGPRHGLLGGRLVSRPLVVALRQLADRLQALHARSWRAAPKRSVASLRPAHRRPATDRGAAPPWPAPARPATRTAADAGWTRPAPSPAEPAPPRTAAEAGWTRPARSGSPGAPPGASPGPAPR